MKSPENIVIVGAGQAGLQTAEALRSLGYAGPLTLLGDEPHPPYHRPPLSKAWLAEAMDAAQLMMRSPDVLARKHISLRTGVRVTAIEPDTRRLMLANAEPLSYSTLVLATGASPRRPSFELPSTQAANILSLYRMGDASNIAQRMRFCLEHDLPVVVIGGGFIGLEVAAAARKKGLAVTLLEASPRLLSRSLAPFTSDWFEALHRRHGVQLLLETQVRAIEAGPHPELHQVVLHDGGVYPAGLVVIGIGAQANDTLARKAGLDCECGVIVDANGRTSHPDIYAAGDCTVRRLADGTLLRLESVQNAVEQGKSAAAAILGQDKPVNATPWFWSDQYDVKLQMAGLSMGADHWETHGDPASGSFSVHHFKQGQLIAVDSVNASKEHLQARKWLEGK